MGSAVYWLDINGYKSIRELRSFTLDPGLNVLIGANGAGKSNFVGFFVFVRAMVMQALQLTVLRSGGADKVLYLGPSETKILRGRLSFFPAEDPFEMRYEFGLIPTPDDRLAIAREDVCSETDDESNTLHLFTGLQESRIAELRDQRDHGEKGQVCRMLYDCITRWGIYHFHDTSGTASVRRSGSVRDNEVLRDDGSNLAGFLLALVTQEKCAYELIRDTVRLVAPFFDDFVLRPRDTGGGDTDVLLEWRQKGSDYPFHPSQLSDGTLRFICLATALLQPNPPSTMLFDEPELGMHPYALEILSGLIHQAATRTQVIVSTQSTALVDHVEPEQVVVVERDGQESKFTRLGRERLRDWLKEYTLGELWEKNVIGGRPNG